MCRDSQGHWWASSLQVKVTTKRQLGSRTLIDLWLLPTPTPVLTVPLLRVAPVEVTNTSRVVQEVRALFSTGKREGSREGGREEETGVPVWDNVEAELTSILLRGVSSYSGSTHLVTPTAGTNPTPLGGVRDSEPQRRHFHS